MDRLIMAAEAARGVRGAVDPLDWFRCDACDEWHPRPAGAASTFRLLEAVRAYGPRLWCPVCGAGQPDDYADRRALGAREEILDPREDADVVEEGLVTLREVAPFSGVALKTLRNRKPLLGPPARKGKAHEYRWLDVRCKLALHFGCRDLPEHFPDNAREAR